MVKNNLKKIMRTELIKVTVKRFDLIFINTKKDCIYILTATITS